MTPRPRNELVGLHQAFCERLTRLLNALSSEGIPLKPFETLRTPQRQAYLYSKGRFGPFATKRKVTNAKPWASFHQYGLAADLVLKIDGRWSWGSHPGWKRMQLLASSFGLQTLRFELPHVQFPWSMEGLRNGNYPPDGGEDWPAWLHDQAEAYPKGAPKVLPWLEATHVERPFLGKLSATAPIHP